MRSSGKPDRDPAAPALARTMGLGALIIYGVGDMLGSGVYALIGKAAGVMGNAVWLAFLASMAAALLTGLSYASLGSRHPRAAGVSYIAQRAFRFPFLSYLLGLAVVASGMTSMATQARAFSGYLLGVLGIDGATPGAAVLVILAFVGVLTFINFWGMRESTWLNLLCTTVEAAGLFLIVAVGLRFWGGEINYLETPPAHGSSGLTFPLVLSGAVLTFYSFVGFEDMLNVTEEVKDPVRNFPIAILAALGITTVIYIAVSVTAVSVVPYAELAASGQPLVEVMKRAAGWFPSGAFSFIALFAITNTALLNYIMGSRLVYGLARQGLLPGALGAVHAGRRTPHRAIFVLLIIVLVLALSGDVSQLASATSVLLLGSFMVVNAALIVLKGRDEPHGRFEIPIIIPILGMITCGVILWHAKPAALVTALALLGGIALLYFVMRPARKISSAA
jgi:APA family basic amino acid/polyamine antiporter